MGYIGKYIVRRLWTMIVTFFVISVLLFTAITLLPGNIAVMVTGEYATREQLELMIERLGLNRPIYVQYWDWISRFVRGDMGESLILQQDILPVLIRRLTRSMILGAWAAIGVVLLGIGTGIISALRKGSLWDNSIAGISYLGMATPEFVSGLLLLLIVTQDWFPIALPTSGYVELSEGFIPWFKHIVLPATITMIVILAYIMRMTRVNMIETLKLNYIRTARLKGLPEHIIIFRHTLRNALIPTVTLLGVNLPWLVGGIVITENVFNYPGIGRLVTWAITYRDIPLIQASALTISSLTLLGNFVVDVAYFWLNPKMREAKTT